MTEKEELAPDWQLSAFATTLSLAEKCGMQRYGDLGLDHIKDMFRRIEPGFSPAKIGRWLGWAQAAVVASNCGPTLDDMKSINKAASEATPPARSDDGDGWQHDTPFITECSQPDGKKYVSVQVKTFEALHAAHDLIIKAFKAAGVK